MNFLCLNDHINLGDVEMVLQVTSKKDQEQYWMRRDVPYRFVTAKEFAEAFQSFHVGRKIANDIATPFDKSKSHPAALTTEKYGLKSKELLKACTDREILLMKRNSFVYFFKLFQVSVIFIGPNNCSVLSLIFFTNYCSKL